MGKTPRSRSERHHDHADLAHGVTLLNEDGLFSLLDRKINPVLLLILDNVQDPHNFGACLRTADAAGVDAVVIPKDRSVSVTPVVQTVACGAAENVPIARVTNLARTLDQLRERDIWLFGTADKAGQSLYQTDFRISSAIVMGAEGKGLRRLTQDKCDGLINIPMGGSVSCLNVSVATGVALFEAVRQRLQVTSK